MQPRIDGNALKKAVNLSVNKKLLAEERALKINLSAILEQALTEKIREEKRKQWLQDNQQAIDTCNELADKNGLFTDKHRIF